MHNTNTYKCHDITGISHVALSPDYFPVHMILVSDQIDTSDEWGSRFQGGAQLGSIFSVYKDSRILQSYINPNSTSTELEIKRKHKASSCPFVIDWRLNPINMKISTVAVSALLLVLPSCVNAGWLFIYGNPQNVDQGGSDQGCKAITNRAGTEFQWSRSFFSNCCIRLYRDSHCGQENGISCPDWTKIASQNVFGYRVTDC